VQGLRMQSWDTEGIYHLRNTNGFFSLNYYHVAEKALTSIATSNYTSLEQINVSAEGTVALIASSSTLSPRLITISRDRSERIYARTSTESLNDNDLSQAQAIDWVGHDGETVHGIYYPPTSAHTTSTGAPPLIVVVHGGPTSQKTARYDGEAQFFATRGYAVLYVNHRGSTGYGRNYMLKLRNNWGIYDVEDSATGAQYLIDRGLADPKRLVIMGGSAGGFTVLQSLVTKPNFYATGISRYGVANQFMLVQDTHKFEERYSESLLGALPDAIATYRERSPLFHADRIRDPLLVFQGTDDQVVPKNQSDSIVDAVKARGVTVEYHVYEGEGHGFGKPENIRHYYQSILKFLQDNVVYKA
jgi:dipeptidyl aminopeptidase/acylaminoacyl peptidase